MLEPRQQAGFVDEAAHPHFERLAMALAGEHLHRIVVGVAAGQRRGHVLLDRDPPLEPQVECRVDDPEAAVAQHPFDHELAQPVAARQAAVVRRPAGSGDRDGRLVRCCCAHRDTWCAADRYRSVR
jgi:hypothetical protein